MPSGVTHCGLFGSKQDHLQALLRDWIGLGVADRDFLDAGVLLSACQTILRNNPDDPVLTSMALQYKQNGLRSLREALGGPVNALTVALALAMAMDEVGPRTKRTGTGTAGAWRWLTLITAKLWRLRSSPKACPGRALHGTTARRPSSSRPLECGRTGVLETCIRGGQLDITTGSCQAITELIKAICCLTRSPDDLDCRSTARLIGRDRWMTYLVDI